VLWYGYIYYILFLLLLFTLVSFFYRIFLLNFFLKNNTVSLSTKLILPLLLALFALVFTFLYSVFDLYITTTPLLLKCHLKWVAFSYTTDLAIFNLQHTQLHYTAIYLFPFIYIFLFVTLISLLFCLAYNIAEITSFFFYTTLILVAGYTLFFTDSLTLFFLAYELLLIPSFLILYNFAKTRRCVEAAYLMFFWTQFGAMFLIFSFLYLFAACNTSTFSSLLALRLTPFEVNFLFAC